MATFQVGPGMDKYEKELRNLADYGREVIGPAIYVGAGIVADAIRQNIQNLPKSACTDVEKAGLLEGFGIAKMREENGYYHVKCGFEGYNSNVTKKYPKGKANSMIARSIEAGTSFRSRHPFVAPAVRATKDRAEKAMSDKVDSIIAGIVN